MSTPVPKDWMKALTKDRYFGPIIKTLNNGSTNAKKLKRAAMFEITANQLFFIVEGAKRIYVPKSLQLETMKTAHDEKCGGHMGTTKTQIGLQKPIFDHRC